MSESAPDADARRPSGTHSEPGAGMSFSVVIVSLNGEMRLPACLRDLCASADHYQSLHPDARIEIVVVDNGSVDATSEVVADWGRRDSRVRLVRLPANAGFAGGNNEGIRRTSGDAVILLNDDTYPERDWLVELDCAAVTLPDWGALGCLLLYPESRDVQHAGGVIEGNGLTSHVGWGDAESAWRGRAPYAADYVTGAAIAIRRRALELIGPLDADYFPIYFEETDYCVTLRAAGFGVYMVPSSVVLHDESQVTQVRSRGFYEKYHRHRWRFLLKTRTASQLRDTLRAELQWLRNRHHWNHLPFVLHAAWRTVLGWRDIRRARREHFDTVRRALAARAEDEAGRHVSG